MTVVADLSHRHVWRIAGPIILSNVSIPLLGAIDIAVVGHLPGPEYVGAVAVGTLMFSLLLAGLIFLRMGTTGLTAQALGAGDVDEVRGWLARAVLVGLVLGAAAVALRLPIVGVALVALAPSERVAPLFETYIAIRIWATPAALANQAALGWFIGLHRTRSLLAQQLVLNGVNIVLDLWFVFGLGLGVPAVAAANVIAQGIGLAFSAVLVQRHLRRLGGAWDWARILDRERLGRMFAVNRDIFLRTITLMSGHVVFIAVGTRMGDEVLAANAVLLQFHNFAAWSLDSFALAAEALAGAAAGARDRARFRRALGLTTFWALALAVAFVAAFAVAGPAIIDALTTVAEVRAVARVYLPWAVAFPVVAVWAYMLDGAFIGGTWTAEMRNAMFVSVALFLVSAAGLVLAWDNHGLWASQFVLAAARAVTLGAVYPRLERALDAAPTRP